MDGIRGPQIYTSFNLFGIEFPITETIVNTWIIMAVIIILAYLGTRKFKMVPSGVQNVTELVVDGIYNLVRTTMGEKNMKFAPYIGTLAIFLAFANLSGLFTLRPPTADLNTTFALALITFALIHAGGIGTKGLGKYLRGYTQPFFLLLPINLIGELATPISLAFRLFGNVLGGVIIMSLLYGALGWVSILPIPAIFHIYFDLFSGLIQTFIFIMLTMVFVSNARD